MLYSRRGMSRAGPDKQPKERVKVWRPQGFVGLEVEQFDKQSDLVVPAFVVPGHELTVFLEGSAYLKYSGRSYRFSEVAHLFLAQHPSEIFFGEARSDQPVSVWTLRLYPELMQTLQGDLGLPEFPVSFPDMAAPDPLNAPLAALTMKTISSFAAPASRLERESRLLLLLREVLTHMADAKPPELKLGKEHKAVSLVKEVMHAHPERDHRLDDLSALTRLNKYHLKEVFTRDVGVTPHRYLTELRVCKAKDLLAQGHMVAQVALETGFADQSHLTHVFKRYTQVTPGRFQRDSLAC